MHKFVRSTRIRPSSVNAEPLATTARGYLANSCWTRRTQKPRERSKPVSFCSPVLRSTRDDQDYSLHSDPWRLSLQPRGHRTMGFRNGHDPGFFESPSAAARPASPAYYGPTAYYWDYYALSTASTWTALRPSVPSNVLL